MGKAGKKKDIVEDRLCERAVSDRVVCVCVKELRVKELCVCDNVVRVTELCVCVLRSCV